MMQLYVKTPCPFSARARAVLDAYNLEYEEKNVANPEIAKELISLGGKKQEPFLVDGDVRLYESQHIIQYIEEKYGEKLSQKRPRIYFSRSKEMCTT